MLRVGMTLTLKKMPDSPYDDETIVVLGTKGTKLGYVANSSGSVIRGTYSAGRLYDKFRDEISCVVRFIGIEYGVAIAEVEV